METAELKFLLRLLGNPDYRAYLAGKGFKDIKSKNKLCRQLRDRGFIDFHEEIGTVKMLPPAQALLEMEQSESPLEPKELKVLEKIGKAEGTITPSKLEIKSIRATEREEILQSFAQRGLIEITMKTKRLKAEAWVTEAGMAYLQDEFVPKQGSNPSISLNLLGNYLRFLRQSSPNQVFESETSTSTPTEKPTDEEILQLIGELDKELGTKNYLPIFHLRQKLQPPLEREELDQALYRLQEEEKIELSSLVEAVQYTQEQIEAGIPQDTGGPLFFLIVV